MQFSNIFVLATAISSVAASCNSGGQSAKKADIEPKLNTVCTYLSGYYVKGERRYTCITDNAGVKWDFELYFKGSGDSRYISVGECENGMGKEIGCKYGGKTGYGNWWYRADPNSGKCINTKKL